MQWLLDLAVGGTAGVLAGVVILVLDRRVSWFSRWLHQGEEVDKATVHNAVSEIHELRIAAKQAMEAVSMLGAWEAQDRAFEAARLILARIKDSDLLSAELRAAIQSFTQAAACALVDIEHRYEITREERLQSIEGARASLEQLLALAQKELAALRRNS